MKDATQFAVAPRRRRWQEQKIDYIATASNEVKVRGEGPGKLWWRGAQWAVTDLGIECLDGCYFIEKSRLAEHLPDFSWPEHMAGKIWVDVDEFATAWMIGFSA